MKIDLSGPQTSPLSAERSIKPVKQEIAVTAQSATQNRTTLDRTNLDRTTLDRNNQDRTTLSTNSAAVDSLAVEALKSPEIRQDKVDAIRLSITNGEYQVDATKIAAAIVSSNSK